MNLEQLSSFKDSVEDSMFNDSIAKDDYELNIKQRLIKKYGVTKVGNSLRYDPTYTFNDAPTAGVGLFDSNGYFGDISDQIIIAKNSEHAHSIINSAFNDDAYSITSQGTPTFLTTIWTNKFYTVVTRKTVFEEVSHSFQQGMWGITNLKIPTVSFGNNFSLYSDYGVQGNSSINVNWIDRQVVNFERTLVYGDLAVAQMSMGKIDYIGRLREGTMQQIKLHQDAIGFFGYSENMNIYGLLNDPSLYPTVSAGAKVAGAGQSPNTLWQYGSFFEIIADIITVRQAVTSRAGGQDDDNSKMFFLLPPAVWQSLLVTSPLGNITVKDWLEANYSSMVLMKAPLLQGTGTPIGSATPNQCVLIFEKIAGQECLLNSFVTLYQSHGTVRLASSYQEKVSYSLGGAIVVNGIGIQIMTGI